MRRAGASSHVVEPVAKQLDMVAAIGDLYRFDRFAAPDLSPA